MTLVIGYTPRARSDLRAISDYLHQRSPVGTTNVLNAVRATVRQLAEFPESGIITDLASVRVIVVQGYPYQVFYRVRTSRLDILHIRHARRPPFTAKEA